MELKQRLESKKVFSKIGLAMLVTLIVVNLIQGVFLGVINVVDSNLLTQGWINYIAIAISFYLIGFPIFCLIVKKLPDGEKQESKKLKVSQIISLILMSYCIVYITNFLTNIIMILIGMLKGNPVVNPLADVVGGNNWIWTLIFVGILSPIIEEMMFRGVMLNKLRAYGDTVAIVTTGVLFGLFHGNFSQFFYAVALGIIFAYVTLKTGTIKYSIILHIVVNIIGSVVTPLIVGDGSNLVAVGSLGIVMIVVVVIGLVLLIKNRKNISLLEGEIKLEKGNVFKTIWINSGMILYALLCLASMVYILFI